MTKILYIALFILPLALVAQPSNFEWAKSFDVSDSHFAHSIVTDSSDNVYFCGRYEDTLDADPSSGVYNLISNGGYDIFVIKLDQNGNLVWAITLGSAGNEYCVDIDIDTNQDVYLVGSFQDQMDFDPGSSVNLVTPQFNTGEAYLLKLDSYANFLWVKTLATTFEGISVDLNNNICLTGNFESSTDFDPSTNTYTVTPPANLPESIFVLKLNLNGNFIWVKTISSPNLIRSKRIETDDNGNILFTGLFTGGPTDFDPGSASYYDSTIVNVYLGFVEKLDANGDFEWVSILKSDYNTWCHNVDTDVDGSAYIVGHYYDTTDVDPGPVYTPMVTNGGGDVLIQKLASNGALIWAKNIGGPLNDAGLGIHVDDDKIYIAGLYRDSMDFDPNVGVETRISNGYEEGFALCLDTNSVFNWVKSIGGDYNDRVTDIVTDSYKNVYFLGRYQDTTDLHPDSPVQLEISSPWSSGNLYVEKINRCYIKPNVEVVFACDSFTWLNGVTYTGDELISINLPEAASNGCDSIQWLNLTIGNVIGTDTVSACNSYTWIDGNTYTVSNNTSTFTLNSSSGCDSIITLNLTIDGVSDISTSVSGIMITANNANGNYQWIDCSNGDSAIVGATGQSYTATSNGNYAVVITEDGCADTSDCVLMNNIGLEQYATGQPLIYPNPGTASFIIDIGEMIKPDLFIYSSNGRLVYQKTQIADQLFNFNLNDAKGVYFVELKDSMRAVKFKLVKL